MTSGDTRNATSSPVSADGPARYGSHRGKTVGPPGREAARASRLVRRESVKGKPTRGTYGLSGSGLSASAALQAFLVSRLRRRLPTDGWTKPLMTWKPKVTPWGRPYCQLAVSGNRTGETDCGLWLTPRAQESGESNATFTKRMGDRTPNVYSSLAAQAKALWATPNCPRDHDTDNTAGKFYPSKKQNSLEKEAFQTISCGSPGRTGNQGPLNPAFACWLMGFPPAWENCAPTATLSSRRSRRSSSAPPAHMGRKSHEPVR